MRTFLFQLLGLVLALLCTPVLLTAQTANITSGCAPLSVNFTAPGGLTDHFWDFQNGANSGEVIIFAQKSHHNKLADLIPRMTLD